MSELLVKRAAEDLGAGAHSPMNYDLHCGGCKALLGPLGVFVLRTATADDSVALSAIGVRIAPGGAYRRAHCGRCHAQTFVCGQSVECLPHARDFAGMCGVCGRAVGDTRKLSHA